MFWRLERRGRTGNGYAALPISNREVESFLRLRGETLEPLEIELLDRMEGERLMMLNEEVTKKDHVSSRPMTPQLFDAILLGSNK